MQKDPLKLVSTFTDIYGTNHVLTASLSLGRPPATGMGARNRHQPVIRTINQSTVKEVIITLPICSMYGKIAYICLHHPTSLGHSWSKCWEVEHHEARLGISDLGFPKSKR